MNFETLCVHAGAEPEATTGAVMVPIFQTSTYAQESPGKPLGEYDYSRAGNPTRTAVEKALAALELADYGLSFSSGLAAVQAVIQMLNPGDHILVCDDVYGGTGRLFRRLFRKYGLEFEFVDLSKDQSIKPLIRPHTKMIWMETPTNPTLKLLDVARICQDAAATSSDIITVVDNTFASPIFQTPLELGAQIVLHSTTKYMGGHSDLIGGALMMRRTDLYEQLKFIQFAAGSVNAPFESFLLHRSIKTLALRMAKHQENAFAVAEALNKMPTFSQVIYPGLATHPQHALAKKQMRGFGGMISIRFKDESLQTVTTFFQRLKLFTLAESLGGVESLVNHPETMTHASVPEEDRKKLGITTSLVRLSVGIENNKDLVEDLRQAAEGL